MSDRDYVLRVEYDENKKLTEAEHEMLRAEDSRQNTRIDKLESSIHEIHSLAISVNTLATTMEHMLNEQQLQGERLSAIEAKDGDMWRNTLKYMVTAILGIVIGFVFNGIFG